MLLETLVGLAIVGMALLLVLPLLVHEATVGRRAAAQGEALAAMETVLEALRADLVPLQSVVAPGGVEIDLALLPVTTDAASALVVWVEAEEAGDVDDLYRVRLEARYLAGRTLQRRRLESAIWRPGGPS